MQVFIHQNNITPIFMELEENWAKKTHQKWK